MILVYDLDAPDNTRNRYCILLEALIWNFLIQGLLQPLAAILVATLLCPLAAGLVLIGKCVNSCAYLEKTANCL